MDELDLYEDLDEFQEKKKSKELQNVEDKYAKTLEIVESLEQEKKSLQKKIQRMLSFQSLLDKEIERLRKEKVDICFRRKLPEPSKDTCVLQKNKAQQDSAKPNKSENARQTRDRSSERSADDPNNRDFQCLKRYRDDRSNLKTLERNRSREHYRADKERDYSYRNERVERTDYPNNERNRYRNEHKTHHASKSPCRDDERKRSRLDKHRSPSRRDKYNAKSTSRSTTNWDHKEKWHNKPRATSEEKNSKSPCSDGGERKGDSQPYKSENKKNFVEEISATESSAVSVINNISKGLDQVRNTGVNSKPRRKSMYLPRINDDCESSGTESNVRQNQQARRNSLYLERNLENEDYQVNSSPQSSEDNSKQNAIHKRRISVNLKRRILDSSSEEEEDKVDDDKTAKSKQQQNTNSIEQQTKQNVITGKKVKCEMDNKRTPQTPIIQPSKSLTVDSLNINRNDEEKKKLYDQYMQARNECLRLQNLLALPVDTQSEMNELNGINKISNDHNENIKGKISNEHNDNIKGRAPKQRRKTIHALDKTEVDEKKFRKTQPKEMSKKTMFEETERIEMPVIGISLIAVNVKDTQINDTRENITIDETIFCTNQENGKSSANDSKSLSSTTSQDQSAAKHLSLGSTNYRFEKVSENVVHLFITRKLRPNKNNN